MKSSLTTAKIKVFNVNYIEEFWDFCLTRISHTNNYTLMKILRKTNLLTTDRKINFLSYEQSGKYNLEYTQLGKYI